MEALTIDRISVLLVEPSKAQMPIIENAIRQVGVVNIDQVGTGSQALEEARRYPPDLVVSSLYLPDMTGAELLETLRRDPQTATIPYVLISSETKFKALDPVMQAGALAILPKPFKQEQMNQAIYAALDSLDPDSLPSMEADLDGLKVLLVDDSCLSREHMRRMLESIGIHQVVEADDGQQAIDRLGEQLFDLVISDYNMPKIDGQQLTRFIRQHPNHRDVPVLMVTSEENRGRLAAIEADGVSAICNKPFDLKNFSSLIVQVVA